MPTLGDYRRFYAGTKCPDCGVTLGELEDLEVLATIACRGRFLPRVEVGGFPAQGGI